MRIGLIGIFGIVASCAISVKDYTAPPAIVRKFPTEVAVVVPREVRNFKYSPRLPISFEIGEAMHDALEKRAAIQFENVVMMEGRFLHHEGIPIFVVGEPQVNYFAFIDNVTGLGSYTTFGISFDVSFYEGPRLVKKITASSGTHRTPVPMFTQADYVSRETVGKAIAEAVDIAIGSLLLEPEISNILYRSVPTHCK